MDSPTSPRSLSEKVFWDESKTDWASNEAIMRQLQNLQEMILKIPERVASVRPRADVLEAVASPQSSPRSSKSSNPQDARAIHKALQAHVKAAEEASAASAQRADSKDTPKILQRRYSHMSNFSAVSQMSVVASKQQETAEKLAKLQKASAAAPLLGAGVATKARSASLSSYVSTRSLAKPGSGGLTASTGLLGNQNGAQRSTSIAKLDALLPNVVEDSDSSSSSSSESALTEASQDVPQGRVSKHFSSRRDWALTPDQSFGPRHMSQRSSRNSSIDNLAATRILNKSEQPALQLYWIALLHPESMPRAIWSMIMIVSTMFLGILLPMQIAYPGNRDLPTALLVSLHIADSTMIIDLAISCCSPWADGTRTVVDLSEIIFMYAKSWLALDLLALWPLAAGPESFGAAYIMQRTLKMCKCLKLSLYIPQLQKNFHGASISYLKVVLPIVLCFHCLSCLWRVALDRSTMDKDTSEEYLTDLYFVVMTVTSVGYGDITPDSVGSRICSIAFMFLSSLYSGFVISATSNILITMYDGTVEAQIRGAASLMASYHVDHQLQRRVEHCLRLQVKEKSSLAVPSRLLNLMTPAIQKELSMALLRDVVMEFPVFKASPESFVAQLAQAHTWVQALTGELVVEEAQIEQELVFNIQGSLALFRSMDDEGQVDEQSLPPGAWFGEKCLFLAGCVRDFSVAVESDSELAVLTVQEFTRVLCLYPLLKRQHTKLARGVITGKMNMQDLAYTPPLQERDRSAYRPSRWQMVKSKLSMSTNE